LGLRGHDPVSVFNPIKVAGFAVEARAPGSVIERGRFGLV